MGILKKFMLLLSATICIYADNGLLTDCACQNYMYTMAAQQKKPIILATNPDYPYIMTDNENIKIDKKNKIVSVWLTFLVSAEARQDNSAQREELFRLATKAAAERGLDDPDFIVSAVNQRLPYQAPRMSFDYTKSYMMIDYGNKKYKDLTTTNYLCSGQVVQNFPQQNQEWKYIIPNTLMDDINNEIIKKYKLK